MPDGVHHHRVWRRNWLWVPPLSVLAYGLVDPIKLTYTCTDLGCFSGNLFVSLGVFLGYGMGRYIDPDLDQMGTTAAEGRMVNEIPILGVFLYGHWATYGAIFRKKHRSFLTHFPLVSTGIRLFYQFYGIFLILSLKNWIFPWILHLFIGIFIGLSFADFLHWKEDKRAKEI